MKRYMDCLKQNNNDNHLCRSESQDYLQCRMDRYSSTSPLFFGAIKKDERKKGKKNTNVALNYCFAAQWYHQGRCHYGQIILYVPNDAIEDWKLRLLVLILHISSRPHKYFYSFSQNTTEGQHPKIARKEEVQLHMESNNFLLWSFVIMWCGFMTTWCGCGFMVMWYGFIIMWCGFTITWCGFVILWFSHFVMWSHHYVIWFRHNVISLLHVLASLLCDTVLL